MIKNKKYLILFVALFGFLFILSNKSSAAFKFEYEGKEYNFPDIEPLKYTFVYRQFANDDPNFPYEKHIYVVTFDKFTTERYSSNNIRIKAANYKMFHFSGLDPSQRSSLNPFTNLDTIFYKEYKNDLSLFIIYSDFDICYPDGEVFFQSPVPKLTLRPILEQTNQEGTNLVEEMPKVMQEITTIIPLTLVVVVSCLGLRKALRMLSTLLHRCLIF